jgi:hypothetical protein
MAINGGSKANGPWRDDMLQVVLLFGRGQLGKIENHKVQFAQKGRQTGSPFALAYSRW